MSLRLTSLLAGVAGATLTLASACTEAGGEQNATVATKDDATRTLAAVLAARHDMTTLSAALGNTELSGVLDGPASYTLLAPDDAAFAALGEQGNQLMQEHQRPLLIGILRDHLLPGHLTPEAIAATAAAQDTPVVMTTLGDAGVRFSRESGRLYVSTGNGQRAEITGPAVAANNGVLIPIDRVLLPPGKGRIPVNSPG